jgi:cytochrome c-type biogenesis protein CcmH/NrfF
VNAIQSGRGRSYSWAENNLFLFLNFFSRRCNRLEQLQELSNEHSKKEQEFKEKIEELTEQVDSLSAENEALAESNAAMVAAMEGAG